jgi:DNA-binding transcriptional ArsR family regulator
VSVAAGAQPEQAGGQRANQADAPQRDQAGGAPLDQAGGSPPDTAGEAPPDQASPPHPTSGLNDTVHQRHRLGILTITAEAKRAEFGYLREALDLTAGNLSRHLTVLEEAGLVKVEKGYAGRRPRTWVRITASGRTALGAELAALSELLHRHAAGG